jgi:hypothetical protein
MAWCWPAARSPPRPSPGPARTTTRCGTPSPAPPATSRRRSSATGRGHPASPRCAWRGRSRRGCRPDRAHHCGVTAGQDRVARRRSQLGRILAAVGRSGVAVDMAAWTSTSGRSGWPRRARARTTPRARPISASPRIPCASAWTSTRARPRMDVDLRLHARVRRHQRALPLMKLWGGNYEGEPDREFWEFNRSLPFDRRLAREEIAASRAYVRALGERAPSRCRRWPRWTADWPGSGSGHPRPWPRRRRGHS